MRQRAALPVIRESSRGADATAPGVIHKRAGGNPRGCIDAPAAVGAYDRFRLWIDA